MKDFPQTPLDTRTESVTSGSFHMSPSHPPMGKFAKLFFAAAGVVLLAFVFVAIVSRSIPDDGTAQQMIELIKPYSSAYDKANELDVKVTGDQYKIVESLSANINQLATARNDKCYNAKVSEDIRKYFSASLKVPDSDTIKSIENEAGTLCNRNTKFTEVKGEVLKMVDGMITPEDLPLTPSPTQTGESSGKLLDLQSAQ